MKKELVCGVGISEDGKFKRTVKTVGGYKMTREYDLWKHMLHRCYSEKALDKRGSYSECSVSENFKNFQYFAEWCNNQSGFFLGWQLDKDIKIKGGKVYSEETCEFVPKEINMCFVKANTIRGEYPIGVSKLKSNGKFTAGICVGFGKVITKHGFNTPEEAFLFYKTNKEAYIRQLAEEHKNEISIPLYVAMVNYKVDIQD